VEHERIEPQLHRLPRAPGAGTLTNAALRPGRAGPLGQPSETLCGLKGAPSGRALRASVNR
jgi:hypothetical protein